MDQLNCFAAMSLGWGAAPCKVLLLMESACLWGPSEGLLPYSFCRLQWGAKGTGGRLHGGGSQVTLKPKKEFTRLMFEWREVSCLGGDRGVFSSQTSCGFWGWFFWLKDHGSTTCCTGEGILQSHWGIDPGPAPARNCTVQMSSNASWHRPHGNSCYQWHCQSAAAWGYVDPSLCPLRALFLTLQASPITVQQLSQLAPPSSWRSAYFWTSQGQEILPHPNMSLLLTQIVRLF